MLPKYTLANVRMCQSLMRYSIINFNSIANIIIMNLCLEVNKLSEMMCKV